MKLDSVQEILKYCKFWDKEHYINPMFIDLFDLEMDIATQKHLAHSIIINQLKRLNKRNLQ